MRRLSALHRRQRRSVDETHSLHKGEVPIRDFTHMELIAGNRNHGTGRRKRLFEFVAIWQDQCGREGVCEWVEYLT